ncbi:hypothetical protein [Nocardia brevicatena]|nr:hypothetical protein [Nocardia brevicatena]
MFAAAQTVWSEDAERMRLVDQGGAVVSACHGGVLGDTTQITVML